MQQRRAQARNVRYRGYARPSSGKATPYIGFNGEMQDEVRPQLFITAIKLSVELPLLPGVLAAGAEVVQRIKMDTCLLKRAAGFSRRS